MVGCDFGMHLDYYPSSSVSPMHRTNAVDDAAPKADGFVSPPRPEKGRGYRLLPRPLILAHRGYRLAVGLVRVDPFNVALLPFEFADVALVVRLRF